MEVWIFTISAGTISVVLVLTMSLFVSFERLHAQQNHHPEIGLPVGEAERPSAASCIPTSRIPHESSQASWKF